MDAVSPILSFIGFNAGMSRDTWLARWSAEDDAVTFDWPAIEEAAKVGGGNVGFAKILLAARDFRPGFV